LLALVSCASNSVSRAELSALRTEVRSLQEENARLIHRIDQLESQRSIPITAGPIPAISSQRDVPSLTVVKVKPKSDPAPKISIAVPVVEPPLEAVEEILEASASASAVSRSSQSGRAGDGALDAEFAEALTALKTGNVSGGIARLQKFSTQNPRHPRADDALYLVGVGLMAESKFDGAASAFEKLLSSYPASDQLRDAMLRLAECRVRLKNAREARVLYTQLVNKYPGSAAATEATQRLAALPP
jgi:tol-pal system protein YbgF